MTFRLERRSLLSAAASAALLGPAAAVNAQLRIEITGVGANQIPLAYAPMNGAAETGIDPMRVVAADLSRTGAFRIIVGEAEATLEESVRPNLEFWRGKEAAMLATGSIIRLRFCSKKGRI